MTTVVGERVQSELLINMLPSAALYSDWLQGLCARADRPVLWNTSSHTPQSNVTQYTGGVNDRCWQWPEWLMKWLPSDPNYRPHRSLEWYHKGLNVVKRAIVRRNTSVEVRSIRRVTNENLKVTISLPLAEILRCAYRMYLWTSYDSKMRY
jgi:hypothetical protein